MGAKLPGSNLDATLGALPGRTPPRPSVGVQGLFGQVGQATYTHPVATILRVPGSVVINAS